MRSSMLHGSETWPVRKENAMALQWAEMRMVRCVALSNKMEFQVKGGERLGLDDIISVLQQNRLRWYGHVPREEDNDWMNKCVKLRVPGQEVDHRKLGEIVEKDCQARKLKWQDAMDHNRWRKLIRDGMTDDHNRCEWVSFFWYWLTWVVRSQTKSREP